MSLDPRSEIGAAANNVAGNRPIEDVAAGLDRIEACLVAATNALSDKDDDFAVTAGYVAAGLTYMESLERSGFRLLYSIVNDDNAEFHTNIGVIEMTPGLAVLARADDSFITLHDRRSEGSLLGNVIMGVYDEAGKARLVPPVRTGDLARIFKTSQDVQPE